MSSIALGVVATSPFKAAVGTAVKGGVAGLAATVAGLERIYKKVSPWAKYSPTSFFSRGEGEAVKRGLQVTTGLASKADRRAINAGAEAGRAWAATRDQRRLYQQLSNGLTDVSKRASDAVTYSRNKFFQLQKSNQVLKSRLNGLLGKFGGLLRRIAPFLRFLDILITGISVYQLIQLTRRMSNAERAILALQAGLGIAGARALRALSRIDQLEAMNNRNAASIKGLIRSEHRQTRSSINGNVNSEHRTTRASISGVNATVRNQHNSTRSHVTYEHRVTRTGVSAVNTQVRNQHSSTRSHVTYEHRITRNAIFAIPARIGQSYQNISKEVVDWNKRNLLPKLNGIQSKLDQTYNKLVDRFNKLWDYMKMDRILNVINTAASVHNAAMLSRNLAASLLDTIGETLGIIGLKDPDGQPYNLNAILGRSAQDLIVGMIGQQAFNNLSEDWRNWNRIISAGAGVVMSLRNIQWAIAEGVENLNTWVARIGNGLEDDGVVTDNKWPWMRENVGITKISGLSKITDTLESAEEITENIYATVASGQEIAAEVAQLRQAKANFDQTLQTDTDTQATEQQTKETESESPTPSVEDLAEFEPEPEE
ncbi:hypothetical protein [Picosynechococcus sp. PCC 73109]|uniref:hypothetical protein n=2 Tax=Picosynechococcus sp. PCC 73109 TaxID=374982 RepID=UPI0012EDF178|nr:hypothetical protein [Picosynechococcus sp. PCC 73109]